MQRNSNPYAPMEPLQITKRMRLLTHSKHGARQYNDTLAVPFWVTRSVQMQLPLRQTAPAR